MLELDVFTAFGASGDGEGTFVVMGTVWAKAQRQAYKDLESQEFSLTDAAVVLEGNSS